MKITIELDVQLHEAQNLLMLSDYAQHLKLNWRLRDGAILAGKISQQMHEAFNEPLPPPRPQLKVLK